MSRGHVDVPTPGVALRRAEAELRGGRRAFAHGVDLEHVERRLNRARRPGDPRVTVARYGVVTVVVDDVLRLRPGTDSSGG